MCVCLSVRLWGTFLYSLLVEPVYLSVSINAEGTCNKRPIHVCFQKMLPLFCYPVAIDPRFRAIFLVFRAILHYNFYECRTQICHILAFPKDKITTWRKVWKIPTKHFLSSPRSDEAHHEGVRRRLLYIHEEMKIYCNRTIVFSDTSIERYCEN